MQANQAIAIAFVLTVTLCAGVCNAYLRHMTSAFDRLLWATNLLARNGFLVIPVSQLEQDTSLMEDRTLWAEVHSHPPLPFQTCRQAS